MVKYEIRKGDDTPCKLVYAVPTRVGGDVVNFVASGTWKHCNNIKIKLEDME